MTRLPRYPAGWCLTFLSLILFSGQYLLFQKPYPQPVTPTLPPSPAVVHLQYRMPTSSKPAPNSDSRSVEAPRPSTRPAPEPVRLATTGEAVTDQPESKPLPTEPKATKTKPALEPIIAQEPLEKADRSIAPSADKRSEQPDPIAIASKPDSDMALLPETIPIPVAGSEIELDKRYAPEVPVTMERPGPPTPPRSIAATGPDPTEHQVTAAQPLETPAIKMAPDQIPIIEPTDEPIAAIPQPVEPRPSTVSGDAAIEPSPAIDENSAITAVASMDDHPLITPDRRRVTEPAPNMGVQSTTVVSTATELPQMASAEAAAGTEAAERTEAAAGTEAAERTEAAAGTETTAKTEAAARAEIAAKTEAASETVISEDELKRLLQTFIDDIDLQRYYPRIAQRKRQEGQAVVSLKISPASKIEVIQLGQSSSHAALDQAALRLLADHKDKLEHLLAGQAGTFATALKLDLPVRFALR
jgi:periplasmic protein TonB